MSIDRATGRAAYERLLEVLDEKAELMRENAKLLAANERLEKALREIAEARFWCGTDHDTNIYWRFADMAELALAAPEGQP